MVMDDGLEIVELREAVAEHRAAMEDADGGYLRLADTALWWAAESDDQVSIASVRAAVRAHRAAIGAYALDCDIELWDRMTEDNAQSLEETGVYYDDHVGAQLVPPLDASRIGFIQGNGSWVQRITTRGGEIRIRWVAGPGHVLVHSVDVGTSAEGVRYALTRPRGSVEGQPVSLLLVPIVIAALGSAGGLLAHSVVQMVVCAVLAAALGVVGAIPWGPPCVITCESLRDEARTTFDALLFMLPRAQALTRSVDPAIAQTARDDLLGELPRLFLELAKGTPLTTTVTIRQIEHLAEAIASLEARAADALGRIEPSTEELRAREKWGQIANPDPALEWHPEP